MLQECFAEGLGLFKESLVLCGVSYSVQPQDVLVNASRAGRGEPGMAGIASVPLDRLQRPSSS